MLTEGLRSDAQPRVVLQPIAAPSVLGLYRLVCDFHGRGQMAHWFGSSHTTLLLVPFAAFFGALAQFPSGMSKDAVATAVHGTWGPFWMAFGTLAMILVEGKAPAPTTPFFPASGFWLIVLTAVTRVCAGAAAAENKTLETTLIFLAAGPTVSAVALLTAIEGLVVRAGYLFIISAIVGRSCGKDICRRGSIPTAKGSARVDISWQE